MCTTILAYRYGFLPVAMGAAPDRYLLPMFFADQRIDCAVYVCAGDGAVLEAGIAVDKTTQLSVALSIRHLMFAASSINCSSLVSITNPNALASHKREVWRNGRVPLAFRRPEARDTGKASLLAQCAYFSHSRTIWRTGRVDLQVCGRRPRRPAAPWQKPILRCEQRDVDVPRRSGDLPHHMQSQYSDK